MDKTQILIKNTKPTTPHRLEYGDEGEVVGIQAVHVKEGDMYATMRHVPSTTAAISCTDASIPDLLQSTEWEVVAGLDGYDEVVEVLG